MKEQLLLFYSTVRTKFLFLFLCNFIFFAAGFKLFDCYDSSKRLLLSTAFIAFLTSLTSYFAPVPWIMTARRFRGRKVE